MRRAAAAALLAALALALAIAAEPAAAAATLTATVTFNGSYLTVTAYVVSSTATYAPPNLTLVVVEGGYRTTVVSSNPYGVASAPAAWIPNATATVRASSGGLAYNATYVMPGELVTPLSASYVPHTPPYAAPLALGVGLSALDLYVLLGVMGGGRRRRLTLLALIVLSLVLNVAAFPATQYYESGVWVAEYRVAYPTATYTATNATVVLSPNPWAYVLYIPLAILVVDIIAFAITYMFSEAEEAIVMMAG